MGKSKFKKTHMKTFAIPVSWEVSDFVFVNANSLNDAVNFVLENEDSIPLGTEPNYIDGSYLVDPESATCFNNEKGTLVKIRGRIFDTV